MCEVPFSEAPELFGVSDKPHVHCFVKRQPETAGEIDQMVNAIRFAELKCIRYRGNERLLQLRMVDAGEGEVCDNLPPDLQRRSEEILERKQQANKGFWAWLRRLWRSTR
jgi:hypothetical protein